MTPDLDASADAARNLAANERAAHHDAERDPGYRDDIPSWWEGDGLVPTAWDLAYDGALDGVE